jgi:hypothetical protein
MVTASTNNRMTTEKLLTAKELSGEFGKRGVTKHVDYFRKLIRACPSSVHGQVCFSDAWQWWLEHKDWRPFSRKVA